MDKAALCHLCAWASVYVDIYVAPGLLPAFHSYGHPPRTHGRGLLILTYYATNEEFNMEPS